VLVHRVGLKEELVKSTTVFKAETVTLTIRVDLFFFTAKFAGCQFGAGSRLGQLWLALAEDALRQCHLEGITML